jgi:hypothetical protein
VVSATGPHGRIFLFLLNTSSSSVEIPGFEFKVFGEIFQTAENFNHLRCYRVPERAVNGYDTCTRLGSAKFYFIIIILMLIKTGTPFNSDLLLPLVLSF